MTVILASICLLLKLYFVAAVDNSGIPTIPSEEACGEKQPMVVKEKFGFVTSPRFNDFHFVAPNLNCSWLLLASQNMVIEIKSIYPNNPVGGRNCSEDFLKIYDGSFPDVIPLRVICEYKSTSRILSTSKSVYIQFKTGPKPMYVGFRLYFEHSRPKVACYGQEMRCRDEKSCFVPSMICDGVADCSDGTDEQDCPVKDTIPQNCGQPDIPPILGNDRIVGGRPAVYGSWPWMVSLRLPRLEPYGHQCGGTLISEKWVLTAGHCFRDNPLQSYWVAVVGKQNSVVRDEEEQFRYVEKIIIHPDYKGLQSPTPNGTWLYMKQHDIALVKLNAPVTFNAYVKPACLPDYRGELEPKTLCHVTGWGQTHGTGYDDILKQAAVPIVNRKVCDDLYRTKTIGEMMLCAGYSYGGHDACSGDSGGPLVLEEDYRWQIVGVVSTGEGCAVPNSPGIYTEVVHYVQWIKDTITGRKMLRSRHIK